MRPIWIILILLQKSLSKIHFCVWCDFYCLIFCKLHVKFLWFLNFLWQLSAGINRQSCTTESVISSPDCVQSILCNLYSSLLFQTFHLLPRMPLSFDFFSIGYKNKYCGLAFIIKISSKNYFIDIENCYLS